MPLCSPQTVVMEALDPSAPAQGTRGPGRWVQMGHLPFSNLFLPAARLDLPRAPSQELGVWQRGRGQPSPLVRRDPWVRSDGRGASVPDGRPALVSLGPAS